jgi:prophage antirepressor-like protein
MTQQNIMPFTYGEQEIRVIKDGNGSVWWVAKDICRVLGLEGTNKALLGLDEDEKGTKKIRTLGGEQEMLIINESGLYTLIFRSSKPAAKPFRKWVTSEVLPAIRRTGCYQRPETAKKQPDSLLPVTREFRAALRLARAMGLKGTAAVFEASRLAWKQTGVNPLDLIDADHLFAEPEPKRRTAR